MSKSDTTIAKGLKAAFKLAELTPWDELTLSSIAEEADLSLKDFHGVASKDDLSAAIEPHFDAAMSEGSVSDTETPRTRLFDVIMMRFEAMEEVRDAATSYLRWRDSSISGLALRVRARLETAKWATTCAGLDNTGSLPQSVQLAAIAWAVSQAERAWRQETSAELSQTMAALDAELLKLEERSAWLKRFGARKSDQDDEPQA